MFPSPIFGGCKYTNFFSIDKRICYLCRATTPIHAMNILPHKGLFSAFRLPLTALLTAVLAVTACSPRLSRVRMDGFYKRGDVLLSEDPRYCGRYTYVAALQFPASIDGEESPLCRRIGEDLLRDLFGDAADSAFAGRLPVPDDVRGDDGAFRRAARIILKYKEEEYLSAGNGTRSPNRAGVSTGKPSAGTGPLSATDHFQSFYSGRRGNLISFHTLHVHGDGNGAETHREKGLNYDLESGRRIFPDDFFTPGAREVLPGRIARKLKAVEPAVAAALFNPDAVEPGDNFKFSAAGVSFFFDAGNIAPAQLGFLRADLPWAEIEDLLR